MDLYKKHAQPPKDALKTIGGGRLKGMTDINPQWRIEALTELFGLCGEGWYYDITKTEIVNGSDNNQIMLVHINIFYKIDKEWSKPVVGIGGSSFVSKEKDYWYTSDECLKMATTDAISVACKMLGIGSDIYRGKMETKYSTPKAPDALASEKQVSFLRKLIDSTGTNMAEFCAYYKIDSLPKLPAGQVDRALALLREKESK